MPCTKSAAGDITLRASSNTNLRTMTNTRCTLALALVVACFILVIATEAAAASDPPSDDSVFLFTSFRGNGEDGLRFLYSDDGYHWKNVPGTFLKPRAGPS
jgi:hypothetical protein